MSLVFAHSCFVSMHPVPVRREGMTRPEGEMPAGRIGVYRMAGHLPARRGQGSRERMGVPGCDWGGNGRTKVPVGKVSATSPVTNISSRVCWEFLCLLKKYQKICLFLSLSSHVKGQSIGVGRLEIWYFSGTDAKQ